MRKVWWLPNCLFFKDTKKISNFYKKRSRQATHVFPGRLTTKVIDWLIDWMFYALSAIFQPYNGGMLLKRGTKRKRNTAYSRRGHFEIKTRHGTQTIWWQRKLFRRKLSGIFYSLRNTKSRGWLGKHCEDPSFEAGKVIQQFCRGIPSRCRM